MNRKVLFILVFAVLFSRVFPAFAEEPRNDALRFQHEYEIMNGQFNWEGSAQYQVLDIPDDNPFVYADEADLRALMNGGTGVVYFGFPECPWCRTLLPVLLEAVADSEYDGIVYYYNAIDDRNEIILDENGNISIEEEGSELYRDLLEFLDADLPVYEGLNDPSCKRLYFPTTLFILRGEVLCLHTDTVESQTDGYAPLTDEQHGELLSLLTQCFLDLSVS